MSDGVRMSERPSLRQPVLVAAFRGWNDGGQGASLAAGYLAKTWDATRFAEIDPEDFFDFQVSRPQVSLVDGVTRRIDWPDTAFYHAPVPGLERDAVLLLGIEPNMRWRSFCDLIVGVVEDLGVELAVTLGSLFADVPHTRPAPATGSATDPRPLGEYCLANSRYEGAPARLKHNTRPPSVREATGDASRDERTSIHARPARYDTDVARRSPVNLAVSARRPSRSVWTLPVPPRPR